MGKERLRKKLFGRRGKDRLRDWQGREEESLNERKIRRYDNFQGEKIRERTESRMKGLEQERLKG